MSNSPITLSQPRTEVQARLRDGRIFSAPPGTPLAEIARAAFPPDQGLIVAALLNNKLTELTTPLKNDADITFLPVTSTDGVRVYRRSLVFLLVAATHEIFPEAELYVEHSAATTAGYFCEVRGREPFSAAELAQLEAHMQALAAADLPFTKLQAPLTEAVEIFRARGEYDKVRLLAHRQKDTLVLYRLGDYHDYLQGYMVPSTGYLRHFTLRLFPPGFVLQFPHQDQPKAISSHNAYPKLFDVFDEAGNWLDRLGIRSAGALNDAIMAGRLPEISLVSEALHEARIARIAADIAAQRERVKIVLIAGPSSSGKTTFSKRLAVQLLAHGLRPFALGLDDYFVERHLTPRDENGQLDYETIRALDVELFNRNLLDLMAGTTTQLPHYDFYTGKRGVGSTITLGPESVVVVEGIHGLNPDLVPSLPPESLYRVYVSALTQLNLDRHNRVNTTDTRLIRRIVRDAATRGYSATDTLRRWESVRHGEKLYIFPFQENSDAIFNSAMAHELAVLRPLANPLLLQVRPDTPEHVEANRLLSFLQWFRPASPDFVPNNSILREFIGGSILENFRVWTVTPVENLTKP